jgi:hypothetical protein
MDEPLRMPPPTPAGEELFKVGGPIDSCSVTLRVYGDDLEPNDVTRILSAEPTDACRRGDRRRGQVNDRVERQGRWLLEIDHQSGIELDAVISQLLDRCTDDLARWRHLTDRYRVDLVCGIQLESWNRGLTLLPQTLLRVAERGLTLGFDIYYVETQMTE